VSGDSLEIAIARTAEEAVPLIELHHAVWDRLYGQILAGLKHPGNAITTTHYLSASAYDNFLSEPKAGYRSDTALTFSFSDAAGCCNLSCGAAMHWLRMTYAYVRCSDDDPPAPGWRYDGPKPRHWDLVVFDTYYPLVYLRRGMFAIVTRTPGQPLGADDAWAGIGDSDRVMWPELEGEDRDLTEWAALTGQCQCDLCTVWREGERADVATARAAWDALDADPRAAELEPLAVAALAGWDWNWRVGPPALQVLSDRLGDLGAALPSDALASMLLSRDRRR
jgi:hypothetical protein